jgi:preprotein translocase subunit SecF
MKNVLNYSKYLIISSISLILIGLFIIFNYGFKLSIEYTGGSVIDISKIEIDVSKEKENLKSFFEKEKIEFISIDESTEYLIIKFKESDSSKILEVKEKITSQFPNLKIVNVETIGSTFGLEFFKNSHIQFQFRSWVLQFQEKKKKNMLLN